MKIISYILSSTLLFATAYLTAQSTGMVAYSYEYTFSDGVYLSFLQLKNNKPLPVESVVIDAQSSPYETVFEYLDNAKSLKYYNEYGNLSEVAIKDIWGYCKNGKPYVYYRGAFRLIPFVGSISHFVATVTVYYDTNQSPYYYDPYFYNSNPGHYYSNEVQQLIVDMNSGNIMSFDENNVALLIEGDLELSDEFNSLSKRKKRKMLFYYIRLYNERQPLMLPNQ